MLARKSGEKLNSHGSFAKFATSVTHVSRFGFTTPKVSEQLAGGLSAANTPGISPDPETHPEGRASQTNLLARPSGDIVLEKLGS